MRISPMPGQRTVHLLDLSRLDGGLNLQELDYRLAANESPEMRNLWWQDGVLQCRDGQREVWSSGERGFTCFSGRFWGHGFFHMGDGLFCCSLPEGGEPRLLCRGVPRERGTFLRYGEWLFYKNRGGFYRIGYDPAQEVPFVVEDMRQLAHVPVTVINADPGSGAGDRYQPENRLSGKKTVWYNAAEGVTEYHLPVGGHRRRGGGDGGRQDPCRRHGLHRGHRRRRGEVCQVAGGKRSPRQQHGAHHL